MPEHDLLLRHALLREEADRPGLRQRKRVFDRPLRRWRLLQWCLRWRLDDRLPGLQPRRERRSVQQPGVQRRMSPLGRALRCTGAMRRHQSRLSGRRHHGSQRDGLRNHDDLERNVRSGHGHRLSDGWRRSGGLDDAYVFEQRLRGRGAGGHLEGVHLRPVRPRLRERHRLRNLHADRR